MCSLAPDYLDPTTEELNRNGKKEFKLTEYEKSPPQIKVTLGLVRFTSSFPYLPPSSVIWRQSSTLYRSPESAGELTKCISSFCETATFRFRASPLNGCERDSNQDLGRRQG